MDDRQQGDRSDIDVAVFVFADGADRIGGKSVFGRVKCNLPGLRIVAGDAAVIGPDPQAVVGIDIHLHDIVDALVQIRLCENGAVITVKSRISARPDKAVGGLRDRVDLSGIQTVVGVVGK